MRIRRRHPLSFPPFTSPSPTNPQPPTCPKLSDPSPLPPLSLNGWCRSKPSTNEDRKLHPSEDPHLHQLQLAHDATCRTSDSQRVRTSAFFPHHQSNKTTTQLQVVKGEVKEEDDEEERMLESSKGSGSSHELQVNSTKRALGATEGRLGKTVLPQRRRGGGCNSVNNGATSKERAKARTKAGGNDGCNGGNGIENENVNGVAVKEDGSNNGKKRKSPSVVMEGSRCSRVNGRGWRCCQQTLVGYSLCEHHLGKGRLRSISSVKGQLGTSKQNAELSSETISSLSSVAGFEQPIQHQSLGLGSHGLDEFKDEEIVSKKRKKPGMVKARSVTSLLSKSRNDEASEMRSDEDVAQFLLGARSDNNGVS